VSVGQTTNRPEPGTKSSRPVPPHTFMLDGHRLRQLRHQRGLSQEDLADQAGISPTTVARLERQRRASCRGWTLGRLARALGEHPAAMTLRGRATELSQIPSSERRPASCAAAAQPTCPAHSDLPNSGRLNLL
jgi:DNA-binding XRE family transcriptional regulator